MAIQPNNVKAFLLEAPTGIGKSLVGVAIAKMLGVKAVVLTRTKQLQDQYLADFPDAITLKGRANYPCAKFPNRWPEITAEECTHAKERPCRRIGDCEYKIAKKIAMAAPLAVLNSAYFLSEANYAGGFGDIPFLIYDEIDGAENDLMSFVELVITQHQLESLDVEPPRYKTKFEAWLDWAGPAMSVVAKQIEQTQSAIDATEDWGTTDFRMLRQLSKLERLASKLSFFAAHVDKYWVWYPEEGRWTFRPVLVSPFGKGKLWEHAKKVLGMSATILDPQQMAKNIGLGDYSYTALDSPFPVGNRPVYLRPVANLTNKTMDTELPKLLLEVEKILRQHKEDKTLLHTVSYKIRNYLMDNLSCKPRLITHTQKDRAQVLEQFKKSPNPLVLLSPSMDRGVDLFDDLCRCIIIAKTPFPDLSDPQVKKRLYAFKDGQRWYAWRAATTLVQMAGRGVRSVTDYADTYILDQQAERLLSENKGIFPKWFLSAVKS